MRRAAWVAAATVLLLLGALGVLHALFWSGHLLSWASDLQEDVEIRVREINWSPITRPSGRGLTIIIHDPKIEGVVKIDEFSFDWRPWRLAWGKMFHARNVRARGVAVRFRKTRPLHELCEQQWGLPPIETRSDPPGFSKHPCPEQPDRARSPRPRPASDDVVRILLHDVRVQGLREIWIERERLEMDDGWVRGSWTFWPTVQMGLHEIDLDIEGGKLTSAGEKHAEFRAEDVHAHLPQWRFSEPFWDLVQVRGTISFQEADLGALFRSIGRVQPLRSPQLPRLSGRARGRILVDMDGRSRRSADLDLQVRKARIGFSDKQFGGDAEAHIRLEGSGDAMAWKDGRATVRSFWTNERPAASRDVLQLSVDPNSRLRPETQRLEMGVKTELTRFTPVLALLPTGLSREALKIVTDAEQKTTAIGRFSVEPDGTRIPNFAVRVGSVVLSGQLQVAPRFEGDVKLDLGALELNRHLQAE